MIRHTITVMGRIVLRDGERTWKAEVSGGDRLADSLAAVMLLLVMASLRDDNIACKNISERISNLGGETEKPKSLKRAGAITSESVSMFGKRDGLRDSGRSSSVDLFCI